jgi:hypothetical protein
LKSKNKQGIAHVLAWLKVIIIKHQKNPYSVISTYDHQTLNVYLISQGYINTKTWKICL